MSHCFKLGAHYAESVGATCHDQEKVLYDEREESAGVKFADADLIGCPARMMVSQHSLTGGVEVKARWAKEKQIVKPEELVEQVQQMLGDFQPSASRSTSATMRS